MSVPSVRITIEYCTQCHWMLRAAWLAQELLATFAEDLQEVGLRPGRGGVFQIWANEHLIWDRARDGGFPDAKELKNRVRDSVLPHLSLGRHVDQRADSAVGGPTADDPAARRS